MTLSRLPFLAPLLASVVLAAPAAAQTTSFTLDTTALKPAAVTGDFSAVTPALAPRALAVLNAEEVAQTGAPSLADVLEAVPELASASRAVRAVHFGILRGSYGAVRWVNGLLRG